MARKLIPTATDYGTLKNGLAAHPMALASVLDPQELRALLWPNAWHGNRFILDDFEGDTLSTFLWAVASDAGTTAFAIPAEGSTIAASVITGNTVADDNEAISIYGCANLSGDKNAGFATRFKMDDVTDYFLECGLTDPLTDYTLPAINDIDTPTITNGALSVAVVVVDTDQTMAQNAGLITDGDATYATAKFNLVNKAGTQWGPLISVWYTIIIQTEGDDVFCYVYNTDTPASPVLVASGYAVGAFEGGTLVQPWFIAGNRTTDGGLPAIDFIGFWADR